MISATEQEKIRSSAGELVERARVGDQNAMAIILKVGEGARAGHERCRLAARCFRDYIESHPVEGSDDHYPLREHPAVRMLGEFVGEDEAIAKVTPEVPDLYVAALILADGPILSKEKVVNIGTHFGEDSPSFWYGFKKFLKRINPFGSDAPEATFTGQAVGLARTLQGVRLGVLPISKLSPMAGWELGE